VVLLEMQKHTQVYGIVRNGREGGVVCRGAVSFVGGASGQSGGAGKKSFLLQVSAHLSKGRMGLWVSGIARKLRGGGV